MSQGADGAVLPGITVPLIMSANHLSQSLCMVFTEQGGCLPHLGTPCTADHQIEGQL